LPSPQRRHVLEKTHLAPLFVALRENAPEVGETPPDVAVDVKVDGDTLTLSRPGLTLTLERAGSQPDFFEAPPSATRSPTK
jgi:hypothetical protein